MLTCRLLYKRMSNLNPVVINVNCRHHIYIWPYYSQHSLRNQVMRRNIYYILCDVKRIDLTIYVLYTFCGPPGQSAVTSQNSIHRIYEIAININAITMIKSSRFQVIRNASIFIINHIHHHTRFYEMIIAHTEPQSIVCAHTVSPNGD